MDYEFWFWMLVAFLIGLSFCHPPFYIGSDVEKYKKAWLFAILIRLDKS